MVSRRAHLHPRLPCSWPACPAAWWRYLYLTTQRSCSFCLDGRIPVTPLQKVVFKPALGEGTAERRSGWTAGCQGSVDQMPSLPPSKYKMDDLTGTAWQEVMDNLPYFGYQDATVHLIR